MISIGIARIRELFAQHLQYVPAFGINQVLVGAAVRFRGKDAQAHRDRTQGVHWMHFGIGHVQEFLVFPKLIQEFLLILAVLHVELSGKFRESFGEPLVMVTLPAYAMTPPLVGALVPAKEIRQADLVFHSQLMKLGGIEEREPAKVKKAWPTLSVAANNVGYRELLVGIGTKIILEHAQSVRRFHADCLGQGRGIKISNRRVRRVTGEAGPRGGIVPRIFKLAL